MKPRASLSMVPHEGAGGWTPRPRKDRAASIMIAVERLKVAWTVMGAVTLGKICLTMMCRSPDPRARAACTYSRCFTESTLPRTTREKIGI